MARCKAPSNISVVLASILPVAIQPGPCVASAPELLGRREHIGFYCKQNNNYYTSLPMKPPFATLPPPVKIESKARQHPATRKAVLPLTSVNVGTLGRAGRLFRHSRVPFEATTSLIRRSNIREATLPTKGSSEARFSNAVWCCEVFRQWNRRV